MKILIVGAGNVGGTLGQRWAQGGHHVVFGTRDSQSEKIRQLLQAAGANASAESNLAEAATNAEVLVIATPWDATAAIIQSLGDLTGKLVIDTTNPIGAGFQLTVAGNSSAAEAIQRWAPGAHVVKAFNTTGYNNMANPSYGGEPTTMFICGDDSASKSVTADLAQELGFDIADVGPLTMARYLEPLAMVWINLAMVQGLGREIAFKLVKR